MLFVGTAGLVLSSKRRWFLVPAIAAFSAAWVICSSPTFLTFGRPHWCPESLDTGIEVSAAGQYTVVVLFLFLVTTIYYHFMSDRMWALRERTNAALREALSILCVFAIPGWRARRAAIKKAAFVARSLAPATKVQKMTEMPLLLPLSTYGIHTSCLAPVNRMPSSMAARRSQPWAMVLGPGLP